MDRGFGGGAACSVEVCNTRCRGTLPRHCSDSKSWRWFEGRGKTTTSYGRLQPCLFSNQPHFPCSRMQMQTANSFSFHPKFLSRQHTDKWRRQELRVKRAAARQSALISYPAINTNQRSLQLPIDYYQVLGAESHYLADAIVRAYEARVRNPPVEGFSQEALLARQEILKAACDTLADPDMHGRYNSSLLEDEANPLLVEIPWSKVPGALCLLQEVGEMKLVLQVGQSLLEEKAPAPFKQDIALAMALAYVDLSREAMTHVPPNVVQSCNLLESASKVLQKGGRSLGPALRAKIDETLEEITPHCVLELLALPLDEQYKDQRKDGLRRVRTVLWEAEFDSSDTLLIGGFTHEQFMQEAFSRMTAAEQVALFKETPTDIPAEAFELYSAAYAHVAEGFSAKRPELIQAASGFFLELQEIYSSNPGMAEDFPYFDSQDLALGRGMCELLLGKVDSCRACLGLEDERPPFLPILEFVQANTVAGEEGNLVGLCMLLESWLAEEVFPKFRDTEGLPAKLHNFFDEPQVIQYLEKLERGGSSPLATAASVLSLKLDAGAALNTVKTTLDKVFPLGKNLGFGNVVGQDTDEMADTSDYEPDAAASYKSVNLPEYNLREEWNSNDHGFPFNNPDTVPPTNGLDSIKQSRESWTTGKTDIASLPADTHGIFKTLLLKKGLNPVQIACCGILFGGLMMAGLRFLPIRGSAERLQIRTPEAATEAATVGLLEKKHGGSYAKMDARLAENLVKKWQVAKAQALGSSHSFELLYEILDAQMLKSWLDRAHNVQKNGWYWDYKLIGVSIDSVTISEDGKRALIEATLQEAATLFYNLEPQKNEFCESTYTARYEACQKDGDWKITDGVVLRS